jgi:flagellar L-ring protein precursor FlgH
MKTRFLLLAFSVAILSACSSTPPILKHTPEFAPVFPVSREQPELATGSIYKGRLSDNWFGGLRSYQVGDSITVILFDEMQAGRSQSTNVSRDTKNDLKSSGPMGNQLNKLNYEGSTSSDGLGDTKQGANLQGEVTVTVVEVYPNGNLFVRGEKQLALTGSAETIQISGIIRPEDIGRNNKVFSRRMANALISYTGTGEVSNAGKVGWGTNLMMKLWPF